MVTPELIAKTVEELGDNPLSILVTGGTGFVGAHIAETLAIAGHRVTVTGRNRYAAPSNTDFRRADIRDRDQVVALCAGQQFVIHCASNTSPSRTASSLYPTNVLGTQHVIDGCRIHQVQRMVHVSSTSIHFNFHDTLNVADNAPLPKRFACGYAETKAKSEALVRAACATNADSDSIPLNAFIVRARAVFGPRDATLLPRIFHAYDAGRLRQIGDGSNFSELTYIDNLTYGLILALQRGQAGGVCTVTGGESVKLWDLLPSVLKKNGREKPLRKISFPIALRVAHAVETLHRVRNRPGEPALTRYSVGLLAKSQTFSPVAAKKQLDYKPIVSLDDGIKRTLDSLSARNQSDSPVNVKVSLKTTGYTTATMKLIEPGGPRATVRFHAMIAIIEHPQFGVTLFDTGYSPRFHDATKRWPYRILAKATPVVADAHCSARATVEAMGLEVSDIRRILVSHFHSDHICGLADFPSVEVIAQRLAWQSVQGKRGLTAVKRAFAPDLIPANIQDRLCLFNYFLDPGIGPFERCFDLFGDGSVRLIDLPGHAIGQFGVLLQAGPQHRQLLVADSVWTQRTVTENLKLTFPFLAIAADRTAARATHRKLVEFHRQFPDIEIVPTHCPKIATELGFDQ